VGKQTVRDVELHPGKTNIAANALSRRDEEVGAAFAVSSPTFELFEEFRREADGLPDVVQLKQEIAQGKAAPAWTVVDGLVLHEGRVFVSSASALWPKLLAAAHDAGHEDVQKTLQ
jgi:hypothetical protein